MRRKLVITVFALCTVTAHAADLPEKEAEVSGKVRVLACYDQWWLPYYVYVTTRGLLIDRNAFKTSCPGPGPDYVCYPTGGHEGYEPYRLSVRYTDEGMTLVRADGSLIELVPCGTSRRS